MGITELVLILFIVLIIFGAGKLPQLGEGLGKAIKGFKKSVHEADAIELEAQQAQVQQQPGAQPAPDAAVAAQAIPPAGTSPASPPAAAAEPPKV
ncbi:MAG: twin-arginine translocase TatA/TatE family subunit [Nitrospirota bacterium]